MRRHFKRMLNTHFKRITTTTILSILVMATLVTPAIARPLENDFHTATWERFHHNYQFSSGPDYRWALGKPSQTDMMSHNPNQRNIRRDAGAAFNPLPAEFFNGVFPTERNNIFAMQSSIDFAWNTTNFASTNTTDLGFAGNSNNAGSFGGERHRGVGMTSDTGASTSIFGTSLGSAGVDSALSGQMLPPTSILNDDTPRQGNEASLTQGHSSSTVTAIERPVHAIQSLTTTPTFFEDGSMGRLSIPQIDISDVAVHHGVGYEVIDFHIGHFPTTSAWDGNIGLAAHNGGLAGYFAQLYELAIGDEITFATPLGTRAYVVVSSQIIHETDFSLLGWSHENTITLVTCLQGQPTQRLAVVAVQRC